MEFRPAGDAAAPTPAEAPPSPAALDAFSYDAFIEILARSLGGIYTPAELEGLATFYRTDLGRRLIATTPLLQRRVGEETGAFMRARISEVQPRVARIVDRYVSSKD